MKCFNFPNSNPLRQPADGGPNSSFTLIELVVVIAISGMISAMVLVNMRAGGRSTDLNSITEKMAGVIKQAQSMSLVGQKINNARSVGGYGIYVDTSTTPHSYKFFANTNNPTSGAGYYEYDASDTVIQNFSFLEQIDSTPTHVSIVFVPPRATIYVGKGSGGSILQLADRLLITLTHTAANFSNYIRVNSQGEVNVTKIDE